MRVGFRLFGQFQELTGSDEIWMEMAPGEGLWEALRALIRDYPALDGRVFDERGLLDPHALVFLNGRNARSLSQENPPLNDGDIVVLTAAVGGGQHGGATYHFKGGGRCRIGS